MKLGLIGNMNNNNFAMMRYFRDLGADAHLLLYSNDGKDSLNHFTPEADTWEIEQWTPFIHQTDIPNALVAAFDFPLSTAIGLWWELRRVLGMVKGSVRTVTREQLRLAYGQYDRLIGSGSTPAALLRINQPLDVFYPYAIGVEFLGEVDFTAAMRGSLPRRFIYSAMRRRQLRGLSLARRVLCADREVTENLFALGGVTCTQQAVPMVYNKERLPEDAPTSILEDADRTLRVAGISLLHHARLMWKKNEHHSDQEHFLYTKNTDWFLQAFAKLVTARPNANPHLFIVEYGPDVEGAKELVARMGIEDYVSWLPKMPRRDLMWLLCRVSIGVGQFYNPNCMIWGGTGWEALASGKPLLQTFRFADGEFDSIYGYPPPPMLPVRAEEDVLKQLMFVADYPEKAAQIGERAREWFDTYNGIGLARQWLEIATNPTASR